MARFSCSLRWSLKEENTLAPFIAGAVGGLSLSFLEPVDRIPIGVYMFLRAFRVAVDGAARTNLIAPKWQFEKSSTVGSLLFILSACQILYGKPPIHDSARVNRC